MQAEKEAGRTTVRKSIPHPGKTGDQPQVYEAVCSVCGKKTYVPFQPDGKRAIYCKLHRNAGQQTRLPDGQAQHQQGSEQSHHVQYKTSEQAISGANVRTMNSSFQKSPALSEETIHLSELGHHKKPNRSWTSFAKFWAKFWVKKNLTPMNRKENTTTMKKRICRLEGQVCLTTEKKPEENNGKKILKPGEKNKIRINKNAKKVFLKIRRLVDFNKLGDFSFWAKASVYINEIMYDVEGSDDKKNGLRFIMILPVKST